MRLVKIAFCFIALSVGSLVQSETAKAQADYPNETIKIIVPVPPGLLLDVLPRIIAEKLAARWKTNVVIENRPGAGGNIGAEIVAKAPATGYTLLATAPGPLVTNQFLYPKLGFNPASFASVSLIGSFPFLITVNPKLAINNLAELFAYAKANPGKLSFGTPGVGSTPHLAIEKLMNETGARFNLVPYAGLPPAQVDLIGGHIDVMFDAPGNAYPLLQEGKIRALGVSGKERLAELPDVPAIAETVPGFSHVDWLAFMAPPETPPQIVAKLSSAMSDVLKSPELAGRLKIFHVTPIGSSPAELEALLSKERAGWGKVIEKSGFACNCDCLAVG